MNLLKIKVKGLKLFNNDFEIDFYAKQRVTQDKNEMLTHHFSNIYTNNVLSLVGLNASGKTTSLKLISFVIQLLQNKPINSIEYKEVLGDIEGKEPVIIETYFLSKLKNIHKLLTSIVLDKKNIQNENKYKIIEEKLWTKPFSSVSSKSDLFDFDFDNKNITSKKFSIIKRNLDEDFLLEDLSIIIGLNKKLNTPIFMGDSIGWTNRNGIRIIGEFIPAVIKLLDPTIEYLKCLNFDPENKDCEYRLKFIKGEEIKINKASELEKYLSSGTIKGINIFTMAIHILKKGGYLIIDELENHFNIEIVASLIRFFNDKSLNKIGATLVFSTHYIELLSELERNDSVYLVNNTNRIQLENLSNKITRNDISKSEIIRSGSISNTAVSYDSYIGLKRIVKQIEIEVV